MLTNYSHDVGAIMEPNEIKAELAFLEIKQIFIAREAECHLSAVSNVINKKTKSKRIQEIIAKKINRPYEDVWGNEKTA